RAARRQAALATLTRTGEAKALLTRASHAPLSATATAIGGPIWVRTVRDVVRRRRNVARPKPCRSHWSFDPPGSLLSVAPAGTAAAGGRTPPAWADWSRKWRPL